VAIEERPSNIPIPDPSTLSTEQLRRELTLLREFLESKMDRIERVHDEQISGLNTRFSESKLEGKVSLDAALRAQKDLVDTQNKANSEAGDKMEKAFTKQIDGIQLAIATSAKATDDRIDDVRRRLDRGEGIVTAGVTARTEHRLDGGLVVAIASMVIAALAVVALVVEIATRH
jgi:phenylalanyl-tRNA synthetase beta subunit